MVDCVFCNIIKGKIPAFKIYEDSKVIAILDVNPVNPGHFLVMPKEHMTTVDDLPLTLYKYLSGIVWKLYHQLEEKMDPDGINIVQNNEEEAGQLVPHYHVHVIPRFEGDKDFYKTEWKTRKLPDDEMKAIAEKLKLKK